MRWQIILLEYKINCLKSVAYFFEQIMYFCRRPVIHVRVYRVGKKM